MQLNATILYVCSIETLIARFWACPKLYDQNAIGYDKSYSHTEDATMQLPVILEIAVNRSLWQGEKIHPPTPAIRLVAIMMPQDAIECDWDATRDAICFVYVLRHIRDSRIIF